MARIQISSSNKLFVVPEDEGTFKGRGTAWKVSKAFGLDLTEVGLFDVA